MADLRRSRIAKIPQVSAQWIKTAAAILLVAANAGAILVEKGIIGMDGYTMSELLTSMENSSGMTGLVGAAVLARLLNGIAIPLFAAGGGLPAHPERAAVSGGTDGDGAGERAHL